MTRDTAFSPTLLPVVTTEVTTALHELGATPIADAPYASDVPRGVYYDLMWVGHLRAAKAGSLADRMQRLQQASGALRWCPDSSDTYRHLALAHAALGRADDASDAFKKAIKADPDNPVMHAAFGEFMILAGSGDAQSRRETGRPRPSDRSETSR
jgi:cytochrome c-type biogenesis protein CcmH/NrfG